MANIKAKTGQYESKYSSLKYVMILVVGLILFAIVYFACSFIPGFDLKANPIYFFGIAFGVIIFSTVIHVLSLNRFYETLSIKDYMKNKLETEVTMAEAAYIKKIFSPPYDSSENWVTIEGILHLPKEQRKKAALDAVKYILSKPPKPAAKKPATAPATPAKPAPSGKQLTAIPAKPAPAGKPPVKKK